MFLGATVHLNVILCRQLFTYKLFLLENSCMALNHGPLRESSVHNSGTKENQVH